MTTKRETRQKLVELVFEEFGFLSFFTQKAPVLASYMCAKDNVIVVDVGANYTTIAPVVEGFMSTRGLVRASFGGENLTQDLLAYIAKHDKLHSRFVGKDLARVSASMLQHGRLEFARELKEQICEILDSRVNDLRFSALDRSSFELPDRTRLDIGSEVYRIPERLFAESQEFRGLPKLLQSSIEKLDMEVRREMLSNINIIGGGACFGHFTERLQKELQELDLYGFYSRLKIYSAEAEEKVNANWLGGSIMGSMPDNDKWMVGRREYEEQGAGCLERKLL